MINLPLKIRDKRRSMKGVYRKQVSYIAIIMIMSMVFPYKMQAQRSVEVGVLGGMAYYNGDIYPGKPFMKPQGALGLLGRYNFNDRWTVKASFTAGNVTGTGTVPRQNNSTMLGVSFSTNIDELAFTGEFNFWEYETGSSNKRHFVPYLMGGIGFFRYQGNDYKNTNLYSFNGNSAALIFGFGFKYSLTKRIGLATEWGMRKTFTDNLDDVSYPYANSLNNRDWYNFTVVSITYKINLTHGMSCKSLNW